MSERCPKCGDAMTTTCGVGPQGETYDVAFWVCRTCQVADLRARLAACEKERVEYADKWADTKYQHAVATQERDAAIARAEKAERESVETEERYQAADVDLDAARAEAAALRETVEWYADPATYAEEYTRKRYWSPVRSDQGERARLALQSEAGRALLDEVRGLRRALEEAREHLLEFCDLPCHAGGKDPCDCCVTAAKNVGAIVYVIERDALERREDEPK